MFPCGPSSRGVLWGVSGVSSRGVSSSCLCVSVDFREPFPHFSRRAGIAAMGESRLIVEELLTICLQRLTMEESTRKTEQGETSWRRAVAVSWSLPAPSFCIHPFQR